MIEEDLSDGNSEEEGAADIWHEIHHRLDALSKEMDGDLTEEELKDLWYRRALELSRVPVRESESESSLKVVTFRLGSDRYGVDIGMVREIQRAGGITPVPTAPEFVSGVINLRGNIISVIDVRVFFGLPPAVLSDRARILVVEGNGMSIGIFVEQVDEIINVTISDIKPPLSFAKGIKEDYVAGIVTARGEMMIIVEMEKILGNPRIIVNDTI